MLDGFGENSNWFFDDWNISTPASALYSGLWQVDFYEEYILNNDWKYSAFFNNNPTCWKRDFLDGCNQYSYNLQELTVRDTFEICGNEEIHIMAAAPMDYDTTVGWGQLTCFNRNGWQWGTPYQTGNEAENALYPATGSLGWSLTLKSNGDGTAPEIYDFRFVIASDDQGTYNDDINNAVDFEWEYQSFVSGFMHILVWTEEEDPEFYNFGYLTYDTQPNCFY